ncbi:TPA: hypothetical protein EYP70_08415, partial [Candidatus Bathyarchaeota archaeon]|nr:hypothetical protein [Candidatus Bathyarchaeota archaeon]
MESLDLEVTASISSLKPNRWNMNFLSRKEMKRLIRRMAESGRDGTPPIIVRPVNDGYEIIDGEQRWRAAKKLGWKSVKVMVLNVNDEEAKILCLSYNLLRGRVNWFKLSDVLRRDLEKGVDVFRLYESVLNNEEIKAVLSLEMVKPEARRIIEEAKENDNVTLQHLALLAAYHPKYQEVIAQLIVKGVGIPELKKNLIDTWKDIKREERLTRKKIERKRKLNGSKKISSIDIDEEESKREQVESFKACDKKEESMFLEPRKVRSFIE